MGISMCPTSQLLPCQHKSYFCPCLIIPPLTLLESLEMGGKSAGSPEIIFVAATNHLEVCRKPRFSYCISPRR